MGNSTDSEPTIDAIRDVSTNVIRQIMGYLHRDNTAISEIIFVPFIIFTQIYQTYDAINSLLNDGFLLEAKHLILTQFELRLELYHTTYDIAYAIRWEKHENMEFSVTQRIEKKINSLFSEEKDRNRLMDILKYLHRIDCRNQVYLGSEFPTHGPLEQLLISTGGFDDKFSLEFAQQLAHYAKYQLIWSFQTFCLCASQYAIVDLGLCDEIYKLYVKLQTNEEEFRNYLARNVEQSQGPFGLKEWRRRLHST